ncbi:MAG: hypothetical protein LAT82_01165 [Nanoarchaeota archaeon]|nr:hypothetical protein [Nanoarchaeota archaeon]
MVSSEFAIFQNYRQKAAALRSAAKDALDIFTNLGKGFDSTNKYLLQRAGISEKLQDRLIRGDKQIKPLLQGLIQELDREIKELDSMLGHIQIFGADAFHNFQRSAISHQKKQADILNELYELGIGYFHALEDQIHARYLSVEQAHNRFREKLFEILRALVEDKMPKSAIVDTWIDCFEFLVLYLRDDLEMALPRHTFIELVEQETYSPARVVLQRYFTVGQGEHYIKQVEEQGLTRRARDSNSQKVSYLSLKEEQQKKIDKIVMASLINLLEGVEFEDSNEGRYVWDQDTDKPEDSRRGIKQRIEDKFKEKEKSPITDEVTAVIEQLLIEFRTKVIELKAKKFFKYEEANKNLGYDKFIIFVTDNGQPVYVENLRDDKWREKNATTVLGVREFLKRVLDSGTKEPQKDVYVKYLLELEENKQLLASSQEGGSGGEDEEDWFSGVEAFSNYNELHSAIQEMLTLCNGLKDDSLYSEDRVNSDSTNAVELKINGLKEGSKRIAKSLSSKDYFGTINKQEMIAQIKNILNSLNSINIHSSKSIILNTVNQIEGVLQQF